ncbi:hypothetical protein Tco_1467563 [Tanacetum coccineum]
MSESQVIADDEDASWTPVMQMHNPSQPFEFSTLKETVLFVTGLKHAIYRLTHFREHLKMEMEIPCVKASANSDIIFFFTIAQEGNRLLDDERLCLADDLKKAHDHNQNKSK